VYSRSMTVMNDSIKPDAPITVNQWGIARIFKFDAEYTHINMTRDLYESVKTCRKLLIYKNLNLQRCNFAFCITAMTSWLRQVETYLTSRHLTWNVLRRIIARKGRVQWEKR